jgi:hypothetical protein
MIDVASNFACPPEDIHSKCLILSNAIKPGTKDEPDLTNLDPLPDAVKKVLKSKTPSNEAILDAYYAAFPGGIVPTWTVQSLLLPGRDS